MSQQSDLRLRKRFDFLAVDRDRAAQRPALAKRNHQRGSRTSEIHHGSAQWISCPVSVLVLLIQIVNQVFAGQQPPVRVSRPGLIHSGAEMLSELRRHAPLRRKLKSFAFMDREKSERRLA